MHINRPPQKNLFVISISFQCNKCKYACDTEINIILIVGIR